jgi:membrane associated rhomboid family serine protease
MCSDNPLFGPSWETLFSMGAKDTISIVDGEWWRLLVPLYMHAGLLHLAMNSLSLLRLGAHMEREFGFWRIGLIYTVSGSAGILCSANFIPRVPSVGSSTALFGLMGALFGDFIQNHSVLTRRSKWNYFFKISIQSALSLVIGIFPFLDNFAHLGEFADYIATEALNYTRHYTYITLQHTTVL